MQFVATQGEPADAPPTDAEVRAVRQAGDIANAVKNSDCFRRFLAERPMIETRGEDSRQVAAEMQALRGTVPVALYYRCNTPSAECREPTAAVAYRQPPEIRIFINRAHFDADRAGFDIYDLASTLGHEAFGHLLGGFEHPYAWTPTRDFTVPYSIAGASVTNDDAFRHCRKPLGY